MSRVRTESAGDSVCPVCQEHTEIYAIGPCDHPICYKCSTRMRVLCSQTYCPICRGDLPQVVYLTTKQKYDEVKRRTCIPNRKYKILLENESVEKACEKLLEHQCRVCDNRPRFESFQTLQTHMKRQHTLFACDLCVTHLKIFPHERRFYNRKDLATHRRAGDPDNRSYRGHPLCRFCDERHMDNDELFRHLRKSHYYCHFCDANSSSNEFFDDYPDLKEHFRAKHFLCEEGSCGTDETGFTNAFRTEIDLKAHVAAEHMGNKSKAQTRELRTIDVSFQVAPRRRGRDAGVISPEDFEDVNGSNRGPRDRRQRRYNNRHESSRNDNVIPPPEAGATPPSQPPALEEFPTLGSAPPPFVPIATQKPPEEVENFPSLASQKPSVSAAVTSSSLVSASARAGVSKKSTASQKPLDFSSVVTSASGSRSDGVHSCPVQGSRPTQPTTISKQSWPAPRLASGEDFPSLGGDRKSKPAKGAHNNAGLGAWTKKQKGESAANSRPSSGRGGRQSPLFSSVPSLVSLGRALCDDGEFPTLGDGPKSKQATWVQKDTKLTQSKTNKSDKSTPIGNVKGSSSQKEPAKDDFRLLNGSSESKRDETKSKKKKKKQKEKEQETNACTEDSGISLSSIAGDILGPEQNSTEKGDASGLNSCQDTPSDNLTVSSTSWTDDEQTESGNWETVVGKKSVGFQEANFPTLSALPKKNVSKSSTLGEMPAKNTKPKNNSSSVTTEAPKAFQDDYPALSSVPGKKTLSSSAQWETAVVKKGSAKKNGAPKASKSLLEEDFPQLQALTKKTGPPPGFGKPEVSGPPPGLSTCHPSLGNAPPGLKARTSVSAKSVASCAPTIPMSVKLCMYAYVLPQDAAKRNSALVSRVRQLLILKDGEFDQFCALSADFRSGQVNAQTYHKTCQKLFGQQRFLEVLPELLVLLPDILKQHELAEAHRQDLLGICAPLNLTTCPTCHQFLKIEDSPDHFTSHPNLTQDTSVADFAAASSPLKI